MSVPWQCEEVQAQLANNQTDWSLFFGPLLLHPSTWWSSSSALAASSSPLVNAAVIVFHQQPELMDISGSSDGKSSSGTKDSKRDPQWMVASVTTLLTSSPTRQPVIKPIEPFWDPVRGGVLRTKPGHPWSSQSNKWEVLVLHLCSSATFWGGLVQHHNSIHDNAVCLWNVPVFLDRCGAKRFGGWAFSFFFLDEWSPAEQTDWVTFLPVCAGAWGTNISQKMRRLPVTCFWFDVPERWHHAL